MAVERINPIEHREFDIFDEHLARYHFALSYIQGERVLDIGCGMGYGSYYLKKMGADSVYAVDNSKEAIHFARTNYRSDNLEFMCADFLHIQPDKYGIVIAYEFIEHIASPHKYLKHMLKFIIKGGLLVMSTPNIDNPRVQEWDRANTFHLSTMRREDFVDMLTSLGVNDITIYFQQKTKECLDRVEKYRTLIEQHNILANELELIKNSLLIHRLRKLIRGDMPRASTQNLPQSIPATESDWEFSLFPSERSDVVVFVCRI